MIIYYPENEKSIPLRHALRGLGEGESVLICTNPYFSPARFGHFADFMLIFDGFIIAKSPLPCYTINIDTFFNPTQRGQK